jgi:hypothetical protein
MPIGPAPPPDQAIDQLIHNQAIDSVRPTDPEMVRDAAGPSGARRSRPTYPIG